MALLWSTKKDNTQYEVRTAGSSLRLYTNHAFHSQYNPKHVFTGAMWDLLSIPALFYATNLQRNPNSVLMLGVGGGTAIHQLQKLTRPKAMIGVEYNLLGLGLGCNGEQFLKLTNDPILPLHAAVYSGNDIDLFLNINKSSQVEIVVYDLLGRKVGTVFKNTLTSGKHNLPLRVDPYNKLPSGQYFYKIEVDGSSTYSKAFLAK